MSVLLLRPKARIAASCEFFAQQGLDCVGVGLIDIEIKQEEVSHFQRILNQVPADSIVIFTSIVAVDAAFSQHLTMPDTLGYFGIGSSSAKQLAVHGVQALSPDIATSEGLLSLPQLRDVAGRQILIIKGEQGRTKLQDELTRRGAKVSTIELYRRIKLESPVHTRAWQPNEIRCIVATSGEMMQAAFEHFDPQWLKSLPWIVVSQRLTEFAATLNISICISSEGAQDAQLVSTVKSFLEC